MNRSRAPEFFEWTVIGLVTLALFGIHHKLTGDGQMRFQALEQLLTHGSLVSSKYSMLGPIFAAPLFLIGRALGATESVTSLLNPLLFVALAVVLWCDLRSELDAKPRRLLLLLLVCASMFPQHVQYFYGEVFTTFVTTWGLIHLSRGRWISGWIAILLGAVNTPASLFGVVAIAISHARRTRSWFPLAAPPLAFVLARTESFIVRGGFNQSGYTLDHGFQSALPYSGLPDFSYPFLFGVLALVLSFGKGLAFFTPGLFLPLPASTPNRIRWLHYTFVGYVAGLVVTYAKWWAWYGGWFWGPRFFLAASVPASLALALNLCEWRSLGQVRRTIVAVMLVLSFWVGINGLAFQNTGLDTCTEQNYALEAFCLFVPEMSVLWHPFVDGAASHPAPERIACWAGAGLWLLLALWIGRDLYRAILTDCFRKARAWPEWW